MRKDSLTFKSCIVGLVLDTLGRLLSAHVLR